MRDRSDAGRSYVLGHTSRELDRLDLQGVLHREVTRRALLDGGLEPGMRVLDLGCGSGDVSFLAAEIVGPGGAVLGIDREVRTVEAAWARAQARTGTGVEGGPDSRIYADMAESVKSMLPQARALGIEGIDEASVQTLAERLRAEVVASGGVLLNWPVVAAWARAP